MSDHRRVNLYCYHCGAPIDTATVPKDKQGDWSIIMNVLLDHYASHKEEYEFQCEVCDYSETHDDERDAAEMLKQHILDDHPGWVTNSLTGERRQGSDLW